MTFSGAVSAISGYVKTHEKLLAICLGVALVWGVVGKIQTAIVNHDQKVYDARTAALQADSEKNAALASAAAQAAAAYQQQLTAATAQNAALEQQTITALAALSKQQATDKTLPPADLAARIVTLASLPAGAIAPAPGNKFSVTNDGAVGIAQVLEKVPVLQTELQNTIEEKANSDKLLAAQTSRVDGLNLEITGLQTTAVDKDKACKADIALVKAEGRKGKRFWFKAGLVVGYVAGLVTGHYTGL